MIHRLAIGAALALTITAAPACWAKPAPKVFTGADLSTLATPIDRGCIVSEAAKTATPAEKITSCTAALDDLGKLRTKAKVPADRAGIDYLSATYELVRAGAYLGIDGVRSRRVCVSAEKAYGLIAPLDAELFDAEMAESLISSRQAMSRTAAVCRGEFGVPKGAPALLPDKG